MIAVLLALMLTCGKERVGQKNLADPEAANIDPTPKTTTVEEMAAKTAPTWSESLKRQPDELQTWSITAEVVGFKHEAPPKGDGDFHVVIQGASGQTMIVEFPDPACAPSPQVAATFTAARAAFLKYFQRPVAKFARLKTPVRVTVTGPGFFDKVHGQQGVARNGIEIHPVLSITQ